MMEETTTAVTDESYEYDSFDDQNYERPAERWAPLGAAATSPAPSHGEGRYCAILRVCHIKS